MYLLDYNHPTELFYERQEALMREARDARFARELPRPARRITLGAGAAGRGSSSGE